MHIICTQENFIRALAYLDRVIVKNSSLPILGNILIEAQGGRIRLAATNLEIGVTGYIGGKIEEEGIIALPARIITNFVNNLPQGEVISLVTEGTKVSLAGGNHSLTIFGIDGKEFPIIPRSSFETSIELPAEPLKNALQSILYAVSTNTLRPELTGVYVHSEASQLKLVATDSFRLVERVLEEIQDEQGIFQDGLILPKDTLEELNRIIYPESKGVQVVVGDNQIFFAVDDVQMTSRFISGKFPDYQQIIPKEFAQTLCFQKNDLVRALKISSSLSSYTSGEVALVCDYDKQEISVVSRSADVGESVNTLAFEKVEGEKNTTFLFQARFLQEFLSNISGDEILFFFNTSDSPVLFRVKGQEKEMFTLVMPVRK